MLPFVHSLGTHLKRKSKCPAVLLVCNQPFASRRKWPHHLSSSVPSVSWPVMHPNIVGKNGVHEYFDRDDFNETSKHSRRKTRLMKGTPGRRPRGRSNVLVKWRRLQKLRFDVSSSKDFLGLRKGGGRASNKS
jgi:hypothetical protein